jgi:tetratricopeptide (TPR) repeat protein
MKRILLAGLFVTIAYALFGSSGESSFTKLFAEGNDYYQKGDFAAAEQSYRLLLKEGVDSGALYYNLGNVCFKQKRLGEAIYFWEKARRKEPRDQDIRENLELGNLLIVDRMDTPPEPLSLRALRRLSDLLSMTQAGWLVLILFIVTNCFFSLHLLAKRRHSSLQALTGCIAVGIITVVFAIVFGWKIYSQLYRQEGIVIEQKIEVRSAPGAESIAVFTVHEGTKMRINARSNGWYQVSLPNGWNGWLEQSAVKAL